MWLALIFISLGILTRFIPHMPNFVPLAAVALFSGVYWNKKHGYLVPLAIYVVSDLIMGLHAVVLFTWGSIVAIYFLGKLLKKRKTVVNTTLFTFVSSVLFFIISNLGVWIMGWYPRTTEGLIQCYVYALPFFRTSLISNFAYVAIFFGSYEYFLSRKKLVSVTT